jgi:hypothetical protein
MKLKKLELHQQTLKNLTHKAENQEFAANRQFATNNPDCSFIISCPEPCVGGATPRNR